MISTSYPYNIDDWRGTFIRDIVYALSKDNDINLSLCAPPGTIPTSVTYTASPNELKWLHNMMENGGIAHILHSFGRQQLSCIINLMYLLRKVYRRKSDIDLVHINWLQNILPLWGTSTPALVGVLGSDFALLNIPGMTQLLRAVICQRKCIIAPNASWMVPELRNRFGDIAEIHAIPFGVDSSWFAIARNFPLYRPRKWLVVSRITDKKMGQLFSWGQNLFREDDELHLFGPLQEEVSIPHWVHYHGAVPQSDLKELWYPNAAGLITLSNHDEGRPNVILEAMAASLPVIASDLPAHKDIISHMTNGWLVSSKEELHAGLSWLKDDANNSRIGIAARSYVSQNVGTWGDCAKRYTSAYHSLMSETN